MKIKNRQMEQAVLTELEVTKNGSVIGILRLHWSNNGGTHGYQIGARMWTNYTPDSGFTYSEYITGGCGYCKESDALSKFLSEMTGNYYSVGGSVDWFLDRSKYHKGGNFYKVPLSVLVKKVKR